MKKIYVFIVTAIIAVFSVYAYNHTNKLQTILETNVDALAGIENPVETCYEWCFTWYGDICVLRTSAGFDINCIHMSQKWY